VLGLIPEIFPVEKFDADLSPAVAIVPAVNNSRLSAASFVSTAKNHRPARLDWVAAY
jgi:hypothetical protein